MATTKFYLDTRRATEATHALRISICQHTKTAAYPLGIKLAKNQWDSEAKVIINHPEAKYWNNYIAKRKVEVDTLILKLEDTDPKKLASMSAVEIRDYVVAALAPADEKPKDRKPKEDPNTFLKWFDRFLERKKGRTNGIWKTQARMTPAAKVDLTPENNLILPP